MRRLRICLRAQAQPLSQSQSLLLLLPQSLLTSALAYYAAVIIVIVAFLVGGASGFVVVVVCCCWSTAVLLYSFVAKVNCLRHSGTCGAQWAALPAKECGKASNWFLLLLLLLIFFLFFFFRFFEAQVQQLGDWDADWDFNFGTGISPTIKTSLN